jgi:hypothetical protein
MPLIRAFFQDLAISGDSSLFEPAVQFGPPNRSVRFAVLRLKEPTFLGRFFDRNFRWDADDPLALGALDPLSDELFAHAERLTTVLAGELHGHEDLRQS